MERPLAAVTGGTGFLGGHIVEALVADGWRVRALVRREDATERWRGLPVEGVLGDLDDGEALGRLCAGAAAVVHAAGVVKARRSRTFREVNVEGAGRVAAAAAAHAPGAAFVLVSSLAAREPALSPYARSKRDGEQAARRVLGNAVRVARPCALYGPGDRETLALFRAAGRSPVLPLLAPAARVCLMHGADAARAVAALARSAAADEAPVELSDARRGGYGWREIMARAAEAVGARRGLVRLPAPALLALGAVGEAARRLEADPMLTLGKARELLHEDWSVAGPAAPVAPRYDLPHGFADAVAWYRAKGWLPPKPRGL